MSTSSIAPFPLDSCSIMYLNKHRNVDCNYLGLHLTGVSLRGWKGACKQAQNSFMAVAFSAPVTTLSLQLVTR